MTVKVLFDSLLLKGAGKNQIGQVYLICFNEPYKHAKHYCGWALSAEKRIEEHRRGTGSRLMEVIKGAGIGWEVTKVWDNVTRKFERNLKNQGGLNRQCPRCKAQGLDSRKNWLKSQELDPRENWEPEEIQVAPEAPEYGPDFTEVPKVACLAMIRTAALPTITVKQTANDEPHQNPDYAKYVLDMSLDGQEIGHMELIKKPDELKVHSIWVKPEMRRKGYGTLLYQRALRLAKELHLPELRSDSYVSREAQKVWESMGGKEFTKGRYRMKAKTAAIGPYDGWILANGTFAKSNPGEAHGPAAKRLGLSKSQFDYSDALQNGNIRVYTFKRLMFECWQATPETRSLIREFVLDHPQYEEVVIETHRPLNHTEFDREDAIAWLEGSGAMVRMSSEDLVAKADKEFPVAGNVVDGREVLEQIDNMSSIGASFYNYEILDDVREISLALFEQPPDVNKRTKALAEEIKASGQIMPLIVGYDAEGPFILEGSHRYDALKIMGARSFPAVVVVDLDESKTASYSFTAEDMDSDVKIGAEITFKTRPNYGSRRTVLYVDKYPAGKLDLGRPSDYEGYKIPDALYVEESFIEAPYRGMGYGSRMYDAAIKDAKEQGFTKFYEGYPQTQDAKVVWNSLSKRYPIREDENGRYIALNEAKTAGAKKPLTKEFLEELAWHVRNRVAPEGGEKCQEVSDAIVEDLHRRGYTDAFTNLGQFRGKVQHPHAWVEVGPWEIDATQDQFASYFEDEDYLADNPIYVGPIRRGERKTASQSLRQLLEGLKTELASDAQLAYNDWKGQSGRGLCDTLAEGMAYTINVELGHADPYNITDESKGRATDVNDSKSTHFWVFAERGNEKYGVDIPYGIYETEKSPKVFVKKPGVDFTPNDVHIFPVKGPDDTPWDVIKHYKTAGLGIEQLKYEFDERAAGPITKQEVLATTFILPDGTCLGFYDNPDQTQTIQDAAKLRTFCVITGTIWSEQGQDLFNIYERPNAVQMSRFERMFQLNAGKLSWILHRGPGGTKVKETKEGHWERFLRELALVYQAEDRKKIGATAKSPLYQYINSMTPKMAAAAQKVYDAWEQDEEGVDDELGGGGICDEISQAMSSALVSDNAPDFEMTEGGQQGDDHSWIIVYNQTEAWGVDIPPSVYEQGGGYSWNKIPGVEFSASDIEIFPVEREGMDFDKIGKKQFENSNELFYHGTSSKFLDKIKKEGLVPQKKSVYVTNDLETAVREAGFTVGGDVGASQGAGGMETIVVINPNAVVLKGRKPDPGYAEEGEPYAFKVQGIIPKAAILAIIVRERGEGDPYGLWVERELMQRGLIKKTSSKEVLTINGIPANERHEFEAVEFTKGEPVLQGTDLPLEQVEFKQHNVKVEDGESIGIPGKGTDARNVSYLEE